jgi:hypothetical protein
MRALHFCERKGHLAAGGLGKAAFSNRQIFFFAGNISGLRRFTTDSWTARQLLETD